MSAELQVRVFVLDAWDDVFMQFPLGTSIADVKRRALEAAHVTDDPGSYLVKFRGAELQDEGRSLSDERVPADGALIVMRRRRVAVR